MQLVIPMSGFGDRFREAGYQVPKPLIEVEGRPIVGHVVDLYPGVSRIVFICSREHLEHDRYRMRETLAGIAPRAAIVAISAHRLGPVHSVLQALDEIDDTLPTIVSYSDFACYWNFADFTRMVEESGCDGAIPCYRGFHPHSLWSNYYAYVLERGGRITDIQEKVPFTDVPTHEFASSGTYYFRTGALMKDAMRASVARELHVSGEYHVSLVYKPMIERGNSVAVYPLQHFMQWGTPQDLDEYRYWSDAFRRLRPQVASPQVTRGSVLLPIAGEGRRFHQESYQEPKPLIPVSGAPMTLQAVAALPAAEHQVFVVRRDLRHAEATVRMLRDAHPGSTMVMLDGPTDGQATTCVIGLREVVTQSVTIAACDTGLLYDRAALDRLLDDPEVDVCVWGARGYPGARRRPEMYGWIETDDRDVVTRVSVKVPLGDPERDAVVVGAFTFKDSAAFERAAARMMERGARVNGEYYVDMLINDAIALGQRCRLFEVDHYLCWGTPDELRTFEYWQSCFHKWKAHPYRLEEDPMVAASGLSALAARAEQWPTTAPSPPAR